MLHCCLYVVCLCCHVLLYCCCFFLIAFLSPLLVIGCGLAFTAACFVFSLFCFSIGQCLVPYVPKRQPVDWGPLASHVGQACVHNSLPSTSASSFTPAATTSFPPNLTPPSIVNPSSTMVQDIAKAVTEAVNQSFTPFIVYVSLHSASGSVSPLVETPFRDALVSAPSNVPLGADATVQGFNCGFCYKFSLRWAFIWGGSSLMKIASFFKSFHFTD